MTTESTSQKGLLQRKPGLEAKAFIKKLGHALNKYFASPPPELSTLPETLMARLGISSWPLATLTVGGVFYLALLVLASTGNRPKFLSEAGGWWYSLTFPVSAIYLLLAIPILRSLLKQTINTYRAKIPFNDRFKRMEMAAYTLNRRHEWLAVAAGTLLGWFIMELQVSWDFSLATLYDFVVAFLVYGLTGWHIYAALVRTRLLSTMHDQVQNLSMVKTQLPIQPVLRWTLSNAIMLTGAMLLNVVFLSLADRTISTETVYILYGTFMVAAILVFVSSKVPASLLSRIRMFRAVFMFVLVAAVGTLGYNQIEGWAPADALYATIITMTTIGYGDYSPNTYEGRLFTVVLSLFAIGIGGYAVTSLASFVIEGNFQRFIQGRWVDKQVVRLQDHYIVCGAGKLGKQLAIEFYRSRVPFVVIEQSAAVLEELMGEAEIPYVQGDATQDETLRLAGVERAQGLIAALSNDKDNVFITLSARGLNSKLRILSRVKDDSNKRKLETAGADTVISPNAVSGRRMASEMINSEVVTLLDEMLRAEQQTGQTLRLEEIHVDEIKIPALADHLDKGELHVSQVGQVTELMIVAIKRCDCEPGVDPYIYTPRGDTRLYHGDILIVVGTPAQRVKLQESVLTRHKLTEWMSNLANVSDLPNLWKN